MSGETKDKTIDSRVIENTNEINESKPKEKWQPPEFPKFLRIIFAIIANLITTLNFAAGTTAIVLIAIDPRNPTYYFWAGKLILLGIIFDFSDGIPARLAQKKPGFFGTVVDSVADTVTFGLAPAFIIAISLPFREVSNAQLVMAILSIIVGCYFGFCTIFRLIRFTKSPSKKWFHGIPSPGAGSAAATYIIIKTFIESELSIDTIATSIIGLILMVLTGTMMIVKIKYPTTKLRKNILEIFLLGLAAVTIITVVATPIAYIIYPTALMGALTIFYVLYGPFYMIKHMMSRAEEVEDY